MERIYLLKGLDCPNCAAKIEKEAAELEGVNSAAVNLMKQTMTVSHDDSLSDSVFMKITAIVHSLEPDVEVSEISEKTNESLKGQKGGNLYGREEKILTIRLTAGTLIYASGIALGFFAGIPLYLKLAVLIVSYVILGGDVVWQAVKNISKGRIFDEKFLMSLSTIGAFIIGEYPEAVAVMLFYQIGEFFQSMAVKRSRRSISDLMDIRPDSAAVKRNGELVVTSPDCVEVGEIIVVKPGEKIPLDGVVLEGDSMVDTSALTGESVPKSIHKGD
ncbi:MAG: heavy metal translocating P-type ATPase, partial [Ruminococcus sp.]